MDAVRSWLIIGGYRDTKNPDLIKAYGIKAILQLAAPVEHPNVDLLYLPVNDGHPLPFDAIREGVAFVRAHKAQGHTVLVACGAGVSRSAAFTTAALKEEEGLSLLDAYREVKARHSSALPHPEIWESLMAYYDEGPPFLELMALTGQS